MECTKIMTYMILKNNKWNTCVCTSQLKKRHFTGTFEAPRMLLSKFILAPPLEVTLTAFCVFYFLA